MHKPEIKQPFFQDPDQPGIVRGGYHDELGGLLLGFTAEWVCAALNKAAYRAETLVEDDLTC